MIIAIDGPAGSGKSTVAKHIARKTGALYIDTGAMYRAVTYKMLKKGINPHDKEAILQEAKASNIEFRDVNGKQHIFLDGEDLSKQIRSLEVSENVFYVADYPPLRAYLVQLQRQMANSRDVVIEGRDTTSVVFPDAEIKVFLDASIEARVERRYKEMLQKGVELDKQELASKIRQRDEKDKKRKVGGLKLVKDAVYIDTTHLTIEEVVDRILSLRK